MACNGDHNHNRALHRVVARTASQPAYGRLARKQGPVRALRFQLLDASRSQCNPNRYGWHVDYKFQTKTRHHPSMEEYSSQYDSESFGWLLGHTYERESRRNAN